MAGSTSFNVTVKGAREVERALGNLDEDAEKAFKKEKQRLAKNLAAKLRRAVVSKTKQRHGRPMGARVRPTIHQQGDTVVAGPHPMLFGTEFGMNSKSGWYGRPEFRHSTELQFKPHNPSGYWWNPTIRDSRPLYEEAVKKVLDETLSHWSA